MRSGAQAGRWLAILDRLASSGRGMSIGELAAELNCTPRTIYRDLEALQGRLGAPLVQERDGEGVGSRWRMMDGTRWRAPLEVTPAELVGILAAERVAAPLAGTAYGSGLATLAAKVRARLPEGAREGAEADAAALYVPPPDRSYAARATVVDALRRAIRERTTVEMRVFSLRVGAVRARRVDPYRLWFVDGALYLVGRCHRRGAMRTFLVDRIRAVDAQRDRFDPPDDGRVETYLREGFRVEHGEATTVTIHFARTVAPLVRERSWHATQRLVELPHGQVGLTMRVAGLEEVKRWVLGFGPSARVIGPPELAVAVRAEAERIAALYEDPTGGAPSPGRGESAPARGSYRAPEAGAMAARRSRG